MDKTLILAITCAGETDDNTPETFSVKITDHIKDRILELSHSVNTLGVFEIKDDFYGAGVWSVDSLESDDVLTDNHLSPAVVVRLEASKTRVDAPVLHVKSDSFFFTAYPKFSGDEMLLRTNRVKLSELDNTSVYSSLD